MCVVVIINILKISIGRARAHTHINIITIENKSEKNSYRAYMYNLDFTGLSLNYILIQIRRFELRLWTFIVV